MTLRRSLCWGVALLLVAAVAAGGVLGVREARLARLRATIEKDRRLGVVEEGPIRRLLQLPIVLEAAEAVAVRAATSGEVASAAAVGTLVEAGDVVARLVPPADLEHRLQQARARVDLARRALDAAAPGEAGAGDRAQAAALEVERARLALEAAREAAAALTVGAPWPARVVAVDVVPGEIVAPGTPVLRLAGLDMQVRTTLAPEEAVALTPGAPAHGSLQTASGPVFVRLRVLSVGGGRAGGNRIPVTLAVESVAAGAPAGAQLLPGTVLLVNVPLPRGVASASGTVEPAARATLTAPALATVASVAAEPGMAVEGGAALAELDAPDVRLGVEEAESRLAAAELRLARALAAEGASSLERRALALDLAEAELALRQVEAERDALLATAPAGGVVVAVDAPPGSRVAPGASILRVAPARSGGVPRLAGTILVPEADRGAVRPGTRVTVQLPGLDEADRAAVIASVAALPTARGGESGYEAVVVLEADAGVPVGARGRVALVAGERSSAVLVPADAIFTDRSGWYVVTYDRAGARLRRVWFEPGLSDGLWVEVACGRLTPGTLVVLRTPGAPPLPEDAFRAGTGVDPVARAAGPAPPGPPPVATPGDPSAAAPCGREGGS